MTTILTGLLINSGTQLQELIGTVQVPVVNGGTGKSVTSKYRSDGRLGQSVNQ